MRERESLTLLGNKNTEYKTDYAPEVLERFGNKHPGNDYFVKLNCPEFTSVCPITGQPDFGTITIAYVPDKYLVESKSLKLYLFSFRNHGDFHEDVVNIMLAPSAIIPSIAVVISASSIRLCASIVLMVSGWCSSK